jgi:flavin-dependent dehydrogenase
MQDLTPFGGIGNYFRLGRSRLGGVLYAGEAAGFQDALWGFGMRYAFQSGVLAARSLLGEGDYYGACREAFGSYLRAGVLNRVLWCLGGHAGYRAFLRRLGRESDPWLLFSQAYRLGRVRRVLAFAAETMLRLRLHVVFCNHVGCDCLWCRHGRW